MATSGRGTDWVGLLNDWDRNFAGFDKSREAKFELMLDLLEAKRFRKFRLLELGSGPGAFVRKVLTRFPGASVVAVDYSPLLIQIGERALARFGNRLMWVQADLRDRGWETALPWKRAKIVVSSYSLHAHTPSQLRGLYRDLGKLVEPGGMFINADFMDWGARDSAFNDLSRRVLELRGSRPPRRHELGRLHAARKRWESEVRKEPALRKLLAEEARARKRDSHEPKRSSLDAHLEFLHEAGFRQASVMWQDRNVRILVALR